MYSSTVLVRTTTYECGVLAVVQLPYNVVRSTALDFFRNGWYARSTPTWFTNPGNNAQPDTQRTVLFVVLVLLVTYCTPFLTFRFGTQVHVQFYCMSTKLLLAGLVVCLEGKTINIEASCSESS